MPFSLPPYGQELANVPWPPEGPKRRDKGVRSMKGWFGSKHKRDLLHKKPSRPWNLQLLLPPTPIPPLPLPMCPTASSLGSGNLLLMAKEKLLPSPTLKTLLLPPPPPLVTHTTHLVPSPICSSHGPLLRLGNPSLQQPCSSINQCHSCRYPSLRRSLFIHYHIF